MGAKNADRQNFGRHEFHARIVAKFEIHATPGAGVNHHQRGHAKL